MKRKWWLWILIAVACLVVTFVVSELVGVSMAVILGGGVLGILGVLAIILFTVLFAFPIGWIVKVLFASVIPNSEILPVVLGSVGLCAILVGSILAIRGIEWSFFVIVVGFTTGCFAGAEYQKDCDLREKLRGAKTEAYNMIGRGIINNPKQFNKVISELEEFGGKETRHLVNDLYELKRKSEQIPDNKEETDENEGKGSLLKEMTIDQLKDFKNTYKNNKSVVKIIDEYIEAKRKASKES